MTFDKLKLDSLTRRAFFGGAGSLLAGSASLLAFTPLASAQEDPVKTMRDLAEYTIKTVGNERLPTPKRREFATAIIDQRFDTRTLGQLALGNLWRRLQANEREAYLARFRTYMINEFMWFFWDYDGKSFEVLDAKRDRRDANTVLVTVLYTRASGEKVRTIWRVTDRGGTYKVFDIKFVAGGGSFSLLNQLRGEYRQAYSEGNFNGLMRFIDDRIRQRQLQFGG